MAAPVGEHYTNEQVNIFNLYISTEDTYSWEGTIDGQVPEPQSP